MHTYKYKSSRSDLELVKAKKAIIEPTGSTAKSLASLIIFLHLLEEVFVSRNAPQELFRTYFFCPIRILRPSSPYPLWLLGDNA